MNVCIVFSNICLCFEFKIMFFWSFSIVLSILPMVIKFTLVISFKWFSFFSSFSIMLLIIVSFTKLTSLYFFIISYPRLWNVFTFMSTFCLFRLFCKLYAASFVNEMHSISSSLISSFISFFIFSTIVYVLPLPAPASTSRFFAHPLF